MALDLKIIRDVARREAIKITATQWLIILAIATMITFASATTITSNMISNTRLSPDALDGDYTTWTYQRNLSVPDGHTNSYYKTAFRIDDANDLLYVIYEDISGKTRFVVFSLVNGSIVFNSTAGNHYFWGNTDSSYADAVSSDMVLPGYVNVMAHSFNQYILLGRTYDGSIEVWKAASVLWHRDISLDVPGAVPTVMSMSATGKYIIIYDFPQRVIYEYLGS